MKDEFSSFNHHKNGAMDDFIDDDNEDHKKMKKFWEDVYKEPKVHKEKEHKEKSIVFGNREQGIVLAHDNVDGPECFKCGQTSIELLLILSLFPVRSVKRRIGTGSPW